MRAPLVLFVISLAGISASFSGPALSNLLLLAGPMALASLILMVVVPKGRRAALRHVVIDGSNVLYWKGAGPDLDAVRAVIANLAGQGLKPGVMFDANVGYLIGTAYLNDRALARMLGLSEDRVLVVPKGVQADGHILQAARDLGARIVSNDRYRDWAEAHPEVDEPGRVIRGGYREGNLWLESPPDP